MQASDTIIEYKGEFTPETVELLLDQLKSTLDSIEMTKPSRKRIYSIFVESVENIRKYSEECQDRSIRSGCRAGISVKKRGSRYIITAGNCVSADNVESLRFKIDLVNQMDKDALLAYYEEVINRDPDQNQQGAGLGIITIALRTQQEIIYRFKPLNDEYTFYEIKITVKD